LLFVPESHEKPQTTWHTLKLHPFGPNAEKQKELRQPILSQNYEEVIFNDPVEAFYDILTGAGGKAKGKGKGKGMKGQGRENARTAEIPDHVTPGNPYSKETEGKEVDRLRDALKKVEELIKEETSILKDKENDLRALRSGEANVIKKK
jgi:YEATS domain-containing protein 4